MEVHPTISMCAAVQHSISNTTARHGLQKHVPLPVQPHGTVQRRTGFSNRPWLIKRTGPVSSSV